MIEVTQVIFWWKHEKVSSSSNTTYSKTLDRDVLCWESRTNQWCVAAIPCPHSRFHDSTSRRNQTTHVSLFCEVSNRSRCSSYTRVLTLSRSNDSRTFSRCFVTRQVLDPVSSLWTEVARSLSWDRTSLRTEDSGTLWIEDLSYPRNHEHNLCYLHSLKSRFRERRSTDRVHRSCSLRDSEVQYLCVRARSAS